MRPAHLRYAAAGTLLLLAATACGGSSGGGSGGSPGVTDTNVTIGSTQPLTGPAAPGYSEISRASEAYFKYINANGGINGRTITYKYLDDAYNPTETVQKTRQLVQQDNVFAIFNALGTPTHEKVVDYLNQQKVPDLFVASGCLCWDDVKDHPYTFGWQPNYTVEGKILGAYLKKKFPGKKFAYFYQNDDFGQDGVKGLDMEIPKSQVVARESYEPTNTNLSSQVDKLAASKADVVVSFTVPAFTAILKLTMLKVNYDPTLAVSNVGSDPITLATLLEGIAKQAGGGSVNGQSLIQGIITDGYLSSPAQPDSWIALFDKIRKKYIPSLPLDGNVEYGMAAAYTFAQALKAAGDNPTRDGLVKAVENGLPQGPALAPFRYSSSSHDGITGVRVGVIQGKGVKFVGPAQTTDDSSGPIQTFSGSQPQAPSNGIPTGS